MTEYIEREDVREMMRMEFDDDYADEAVDRLPAAEVAPVRHGRWIGYDGDSWKCSICGEENCYAYDLGVKKLTDNYCPNCGAKMDGGTDNGE